MIDSAQQVLNERFISIPDAASLPRSPGGGAGPQRPKFLAAKSQLTTFHHSSANFARALR